MGIRRLLSLVIALAFAAVSVFLGVGAASATTTGPETVVSGSFLRNLAFTPDGSEVWVTSYDTHKIFGFTTDSAQTSLGTIDLPGTPEGIVILPDGIHAVVPMSDLDDLAYVNLDTQVVTRPFASPGKDYPADIALSPDGTRVAVSYFLGNAVTIFNLSDFSIVQTWNTGGWAATVAFTPDGSSILVTDYQSNVVDVFVPGVSVPVSVPVGGFPFGQAFSPDGSRYLLAETGPGNISDLNAANLLSAPLTTQLGFANQYMGFTPDGSQIWVPSLEENKIRIFDAASWTELPSIDLAGHPRQVWFTPDGCQAYVQLETGSAVVRYQLDPCFTPASSGGDGDTDTSGTDGTEEVEKSLANTGVNGDVNTTWTMFALAVLTAGAGALIVRRALRK
jgi:DNA-binding beta-propeller fold protein YncE